MDVVYEELLWQSVVVYFDNTDVYSLSFEAYLIYLQEFQLVTDVLHIVFGAILSQLNENSQEQIIVYASKTLKPTEFKYGSTELKAAAVIWALKHF
ncbi:hypothetical protein G9A89_011977 [Geosiphon pyriformis]|nr:hypothetical protein G9A89_011977 [Geosiphon pyriformis]